MPNSLIIDYNNPRDIKFIVQNSGATIPQGDIINIQDTCSAFINLPSTIAIEDQSSFIVENLSVKDVLGGPWPIQVKYKDSISNICYIDTTYGTCQYPFTLETNIDTITYATPTTIQFIIKYNNQPIKAKAAVSIEAPNDNWINLPMTEENHPVEFITDNQGTITIPNLQVITQISTDAPLRIRIGVVSSMNFKYTNNVYFTIT
jgi:hypothetical protein